MSALQLQIRCIGAARREICSCCLFCSTPRVPLSERNSPTHPLYSSLPCPPPALLPSGALAPGTSCLHLQLAPLLSPSSAPVTCVPDGDDRHSCGGRTAEQGGAGRRTRGGRESGRRVRVVSVQLRFGAPAAVKSAADAQHSFLGDPIILEGDDLRCAALLNPKSSTLEVRSPPPRA